MSTSLKPIPDSNHIESTEIPIAAATQRTQELSTNEQDGPEWPINISSARSSSTGDGVCDFGAHAEDQSLLGLPCKFHDLEFTFTKKTGFSCCCPQHDRKVIISSYDEGREIRIYSKKGENIAAKNRIPFTHTNPIVTIGTGVIDIRRSDGSIVTLRSQNPTLITLLANEIDHHRKQVILFHNMLWKWTHCFQSGVIRIIQAVRNTQEQTNDTRTRTLRYEKHIKSMSKHFITTALRYLTNHLQHSAQGYTYLLRYFFDKWYREYNRNCIKESIKKKHERVRCVTNIFNSNVSKNKSFGNSITTFAFAANSIY